MSDYTGDVIEEPKDNPAAHRVWELVSIFQQAQNAWLALVDGIGEGYSKAWYAQQKLLGAIKDEIQVERERAAFVLSIFCAGFAGGLMGGIVGGAFGKDANEFVKDFWSSVADDSGSQVGGTAISYFQSKLPTSPFESPGLEPSSYHLGMSKNARVFFLGLNETIGQVIQDLKSRKIPADEAEKWYQYFRNVWFIKKIPSTKEVDRDFTPEASLCLWIAWGAERNFGYWNGAWNAALAGKLWPYKDIMRWDPILEEIKAINPVLPIWVTQNTPGGDDGGCSEVGCWTGTSGAGRHLDVRKLAFLGLYSDIPSANAMSNYFVRHGMVMNSGTAKTALGESFSRGSEFLRAGKS